MNFEKQNLSSIRKEVVTVITNLYHTTISALKSARTPGPVKTICGLKNYMPAEITCQNTAFGHEAEEIPVYRNEQLTNVIIKELRLKPSSNCVLQVMGDTRDFKVGDRIKIGTRALIFYGRVVGRNDMNGDLLSSIEIAFFRDRSKLPPLETGEVEN